VVQLLGRRRGRVLVVDEEDEDYLEIGGRALWRILRREHDVIAHRPRSALANLLSGERYDAIVCEMLMPTMCGVEIHRELLYHCPAQAARMVFVAEGLTQATHQVFLHNFARPCLRRPFSKDAVRMVVQKVVET
jgi:CheY-like chemotaxis protein